MKRISQSLLLAALLLTSCDNVVFDNPQPVDGKSISNLNNAFPGIFISSDNDTLTITKNTISLGSGNKFTVTGTLGKNLDVREYSNGFVVNLSESVKGRLVWIAYLFKLSNDSLFISFSDINPNKLAEIEKGIANIVPYENINNENKENSKIILKPRNSAEFDKLVNAGIFNKTFTMRMERPKP
ncbi:MAG TPA: hypothetical protein ENN49_03650 [Bacteroidales bacterium]|nr:hypothetical protein [Bacteroidales bacterium]